MRAVRSAASWVALLLLVGKTAFGGPNIDEPLTENLTSAICSSVSAGKRLPRPKIEAFFEPADAIENIHYINKPLKFNEDPFPGSPPLSEFMTPKGKIVLFRVLTQPYQRDYHRSLSRKVYAYSLNPMTPTAEIKKFGAEFEKRSDFNPYVLIAINDLNHDKLTCNWLGVDPVTPQTKVGKDLGYQLDVPYANENVVATVPLRAFQTVLTQQKSVFSLRDLLEALAPYMEMP